MKEPKKKTPSISFPPYGKYPLFKYQLKRSDVAPVLDPDHQLYRLPNKKFIKHTIITYVKCRQKTRNTKTDRHRRPLSKEFNERLKQIVEHEAKEVYRGQYESPEEMLEQLACGELPRSFSRQFWGRVMEHFPNERSNTLLMRVINLYYNGKKGQWSEEDKKRLIELMSEYGCKWNKIAKIIKRPPHLIEQKYKHLLQDDNFKFTPEYDDLLLTLVRLFHDKERYPEDDIKYPKEHISYRTIAMFFPGVCEKILQMRYHTLRKNYLQSIKNSDKNDDNSSDVEKERNKEYKRIKEFIKWLYELDEDNMNKIDWSDNPLDLSKVEAINFYQKIIRKYSVVFKSFKQQIKSIYEELNKGKCVIEYKKQIVKQIKKVMDKIKVKEDGNLKNVIEDDEVLTTADFENNEI